MLEAQPSRRGLLLGLGAGLICAPAIVRAASLMPIKPLAEVPLKQFVVTGLVHDSITLEEYSERILQPMVDRLVKNVEMLTLSGSYDLSIGDIITFSGVNYNAATF